MRKSRRQKLIGRRRRIAYRLRNRNGEGQPRAMFTASNIPYDLADKDRGLGEGGIGARHLRVRWVGLNERMDEERQVLKRHLPDQESDPVLNIA